MTKVLDPLGLFTKEKTPGVTAAPTTPASDPAAAAQREAAAEEARLRGGRGRASTVIAGLGDDTGAGQSAALRLLGG